MNKRTLCTYLLLAFSLATLSRCTNPGATHPDTYGDSDTSQIARDTGMEVTMDLSYEFQKTLVQNDSVVFDFLAFDKPTGARSDIWESKFLIIRRTADASDTIIRGQRSGPVRSVWLSDMDRDGNPEIMFYEYPKASEKKFILYAFETRKGKKVLPLQTVFTENIQHYRGGDTLFVFQNRLIRRFPYYRLAADTAAAGSVWQSYRLHDGKLVLENQKEVL